MLRLKADPSGPGGPGSQGPGSRSDPPLRQGEPVRRWRVSQADRKGRDYAIHEPSGYRRTAEIKRPKLDAFVDQIDHWLVEDKARPRKQRHTSKRIFERLRNEYGFDGGYTIVKDYVRTKKRGSRGMFVPLSHPAGHAQADFGEALVMIGGVEQKACFFALDLPHSDACCVRAYPAANTGAWLDGHVHAFAFFGAVPQSILYDILLHLN